MEMTKTVVSTPDRPLVFTHVTKFRAYGQTAIICHDEYGRYWGIRPEYLNGSGMVVKPLNGITGYMEPTLEACLERVERNFHVDALQKQGVQLEVACLMVVGHMSREDAEARWAEVQAALGKGANG